MTNATLPIFKPHAFLNNGEPAGFRCRQCLRAWKTFDDAMKCCDPRWSLEERFMKASTGWGIATYHVWVRRDLES